MVYGVPMRYIKAIRFIWNLINIVKLNILLYLDVIKKAKVAINQDCGKALATVGNIQSKVKRLSEFTNSKARLTNMILLSRVALLISSKLRLRGISIPTLYQCIE